MRQYTPGPVKSTLDPLEGNKVKLSVEVDEAEFDRDIDAAFKKLAREVRLPGFRAGKAPRRILEARLGVAPARQQALQDSIPVYLAKAVREHDVDLIATPEIEITGGEEEGDVQFDATCEVRPEITVGGYGGLRIELPALEPTDDEVQAVLDNELRRHGSLSPVDRAIATGDFVTLDLAATRDGEPVPGLNTDDWSYEVGNGWVADDFDDHLTGARKGDELEFSAMPTGTEDEADFEVKVTEVQALELPELSDEWVGEHIGEFDTVDEWRASARERLAEVKLNQARSQLMDRATAALAELVDEEPPESMVSAELQSRVQNFVQQLQAQGIPVDQWLAGHRPGRGVVHRGHARAVGAGRQGRPRRCGRWPRPRRWRSPTTTSRPSTSGSASRSTRRRPTCARPTSATTPSPTSPPSCASRRRWSGCSTRSRSSTLTATASKMTCCSATASTTMITASTITTVTTTTSTSTTTKTQGTE